jgi:DNA-damage-inducible protein J
MNIPRNERGTAKMGESTNVSIRMDTNLKKQAEELFSDLGLNMTVAMTMFLRQAIRTQGIPFEISRIPNAETIAAMKEAESIAHDPNVKGYTNLEELFRDLKS